MQVHHSLPSSGLCKPVTGRSMQPCVPCFWWVTGWIIVWRPCWGFVSWVSGGVWHPDVFISGVILQLGTTSPQLLSCLPPFSLLFSLLLFLFLAARPGDIIVKTVNNNSYTTIETQDTQGFYLGVETRSGEVRRTVPVKILPPGLTRNSYGGRTPHNVMWIQQSLALP